MAELKLQQVSAKVDSTSSPAEYRKAVDIIEAEKDLNTTTYVSEGITFLALIIICAVYVYRVVRQQIRVQQQQQNFMMAITHELKTPIAVARLNLETLQKHQLDDAKRQKLIHMTLQETTRLNNLASNILVSSQLEAGKYRIAKDELDFSDLVKKCAEDFKHRFPDRNLHTEIQSEVDLEGDPLLLEIMVNNLLENAVKYSPKNGTIECRVVAASNRVVFSVADQGPGIDDKEKKRIFEKFYRIGSEQTRTTQGTGLGLFLCKKIARDHNGDIEVTDNNPTGCNFTVRFNK